MKNRVSRRSILSLLGATSLTGCQSILDGQPSSSDINSDQSAETETPTRTEQPTDEPTPRETETNTTEEHTTTEENNVHPADNIQETGTINLQPADPDAEYAESIIFNQYQGELDVELDLEQAETNRHIENNASGRQDPDPNPYQEAVQNFVDAAVNQDDEWFQTLHEEYIESMNGENLGHFPETVDWDIYTEENFKLSERWNGSRLREKLYQHQVVNMDGVSSTDNQFIMQMMNNTEQGYGFNTLVWEHQANGHGLGAAITGLNRNGDTEEQETWVVQTDRTENQQIVTWQDSVYSTGDGDETHPAYTETVPTGFYSKTARGLGQDERINVGENLADQFQQFFRNPSSRNAYELLDPMTASAFIANQNEEANIHLSEDTLEIR